MNFLFNPRAVGIRNSECTIIIIKNKLVSRLFANIYHFLNFADEHTLNDNFRNVSRKLVITIFVKIIF